jgi:hypothetical protein
MSTSASPAAASPAPQARETDRFLILIVLLVALLVGAAFVMVLNQPAAGYMAEDRPAGVAYNYLLALQLGEYERAYGYLSPTLPGYPANLAAFVDDVKDEFTELTSNYTLEVGPVVVSDEQAAVTIRVTHYYEGGLFGVEQWVEANDMLLALEEGAWKLVEADHYWSMCWQRPNAAQCAP